MPLASEIGLQVDLAAAIIAIIALVISIWIARRQSRLEIESLRLQRDSDIIEWSNVALDACCQAEMLMRPEYAEASVEADFERKRFEVLASISCCIDRGRLYFPNIDADAYGLHKEAAFRGHRHTALDQLVAVYDLLREVSHREPYQRASLRRGL
jgi:hypothetical protein